MADESNEETRHQAMPEGLRASEIRYRRLFESARDGILILDAASRKITDVNPFMVELLGYSRDEFLGKELWEIGLFKDKHESQTAFGELQATGYIRYEDLPLQTKAGTQWNVEFVSNVYQEDGHQVIQCNIRDITERRRIEERLKQNEQRLRTIFEASHEGIVVEENERINYVNKSYLRLLGYDDPEELIGQHISVVISPEDAERLLEFGRSRLRGEQSPSEYEFKGRRKDGSLIEVEASVSISNVADSYYITTMIRDITERHRTEEALRESETRFRAMFEQANVGIVQASFEGRLLVVNPGFCQIIGYAEEEARGMTIRDITHPDDYEREAELTRRLAAGEIPGYVLEKRYIRKDGKIVWGQMTAALIREASGEPHYMLAVVEDITGRKRAEELLRASEAQLRTLFDEAPVGVYLIDADFRLRAVNPTAMPVFGDIPDLIGRDFDEVIHVLWERRYADELVRLFRRTLETGEPHFATERIEERRDRGVTEYYEWQINRIPLPEGVYGVVCYFRDVSASVSARQKIAESEEKYRTLFESIDEGFCIVEVLFDGDEKPVDYRFLEVSPSFERQTGIANAAGRLMREIAPRHEEYWFEIYGKVALTGEPVRFENRAEQLHRWYDVYAFRVDEPRLGRVGILFQDITGRKRAEEALRASEHRLQRMVNVPRVGVLTYDHSGALLHANDAFLEMVGHNREEFPAKKFTWRDFTPPEYVEASERVMEQLRETGRGGPYEKEYFRKDGSRMWFMFVAADLGDGTIVEYATDITERKRAEEALKQSHEELHQHTDELERFNRVAVGRELRMIELKKEVNGLSRRLGEDQPYPLEFEKGGRMTDE